MRAFGSNNLKQGISTPKSRKPARKHLTEEEALEYEEVVDPECGCKKIIRKKSKLNENESDVDKQPEQVWAEDETQTTKTKRSRARKRS